MSRKRLAGVAISLLVMLSSPALLAAQDLEQGAQELGRQLSEAMAGSTVKKTAVAEFTDLNEYQSALGQFIAEELITQLAGSGKPRQFDVVERRQLARVLREQELSESSLFDASSIAKIGKILGIEAIVTGSIADLGTDIKINARVISVETAKVIAAASTKIPKSETVQQLMRQGAAPQAGKSTAGGPSPLRQTQRGDAFFQNAFLRIDVSSMTLSKTKHRLTMSLVLQNVTKEDILIAVLRGYNGCSSQVTDNSGATVPANDRGRVTITDLTCIDDMGYSAKQNYTALSPGVRTLVVIVFEANDQEFAGTLFSFSAEFLRIDDGKNWSRFTAGIPDLELRK